MMSKLTKQELEDWLYDNEEDPIVDGPVTLSEREQEEFMQTLDPTIIDETDFSFIAVGGGAFSETETDYLLDRFCEFLNKKGYAQTFRTN